MKRASALALSLAMAVGSLPLVPSVALADVGAKSAGNTTLGYEVLKPTGQWSKDGGKSVYFGSLQGNNKYRVLTMNADGTLLLDCDTIVQPMAFGSNNTWSGSTVQTWLNGTDGDTFNSPFSNVENNCIVTTTKDESTYQSYKDAALDGKKFFVLGAAEANDYYLNNDARKKNGALGHWWLRSAYEYHPDCAGCVRSYGNLY